MFVRKKRIGSRQYYYLVRSVRGLDGKVRQEHVEYLGAQQPGVKELKKIIRKHNKRIKPQ
jgi:hypothetical protein